MKIAMKIKIEECFAGQIRGVCRAWKALPNKVERIVEDWRVWNEIKENQKKKMWESVNEEAIRDGKENEVRLPSVLEWRLICTKKSSKNINFRIK